jgi:peptidoglycan/xylan/chitin deacetylase (PgdA/CDA1 family)
VNRRFKRAIERGLLVAGAPALARRFHRTRALVLMYHNIVPEGAPEGGERSLHLGQRAFAAQLDFLAQTCEVVPLERLVDGRSRATGRIRVAITFDDAYAGAITVGAEELAKRGMPATIFVPPGLLGRHPWWDVVANQTDGEIDPVVRDELLTKGGGREEPALATAAGGLVGGSGGDEALATPIQPPENLRIAQPDQVLQVSKRAGFTIGSHTWTHPNLSAASEEDLRVELERPLVWLRELIGSPIQFVSYPYGLSSPRVEEAARRAGYSAGFLAGGGWLPDARALDRFALPRFNIPSGLSADGFELRLSGLGLR